MLSQSMQVRSMASHSSCVLPPLACTCLTHDALALHVREQYVFAVLLGANISSQCIHCLSGSLGHALALSIHSAQWSSGRSHLGGQAMLDRHCSEHTGLRFLLLLLCLSTILPHHAHGISTLSCLSGWCFWL